MARAKKTAAAAKSTPETTTVESVNQTTGEVEVVDLNSRRPQANAYLPMEKGQGYWPQVGAVWINSNGSLNLKVNPGMSLNGRVQIQARKGFKFVLVPIEGNENLEALSE